MNHLNYKDWQITSDLLVSSYEDLEDLLLARQAIGPEDHRAFFQPQYSDLPDPFLFQDMALAVELILGVKAQGGRIHIYGDYDCDGISATALLMNYFSQLGIRTSYSLPSRLGTGYGLNDQVVEQILADRPDLLITVDNGSSAQAEVSQFMQAGLPVIVTDHHQLPENPPQPLAFLNPHRPGDSYPFKDLAGVGVALQLARAVDQRLGLQTDPGPWLALAALGTIADSMPLLGDNRVIVSLGLEAFGFAAPLGLQKLVQRLQAEGRVTAEFLAFSVASRINAAGRLNNTEPAIQLLLSQDDREIDRLLDELEGLNTGRSSLEADILQAARAQIHAQTEEERDHILLVADPSWHPGVIGIIAARLVDEFNRPAVCFGGIAGEYRGSARSIGDFDILSALRSAGPYCESVGGHRQAAGVTLLPDNYAAFSAAVRAYTADHAAELAEEPGLTAFASLDHNLINEDCLALLQRFAPFGNSNEKPIFLLKNLRVQSMRRIGDGSHLSPVLRLEDGREIRCIAFRKGDWVDLYRAGDSVDVLADLQEHSWKGRNSLQLQILDMQPGQDDLQLYRAEDELARLWLSGTPLEELADPGGPDQPCLCLPIQAMGPFWLYLAEMLRDQEAILLYPAYLARAFQRKSGINFSGFACRLALVILAEAGLIKLTPRPGNRLRITAQRQGDRPTLSAQASWQRLDAEGGLKA